MLLYLSHLQLGLCHDVYATFLRAKGIYLESVGDLHGTYGEVGDHILQVSGAFF